MGIGYFGDARLQRNGELIVQRVTERQVVCVRKLADDRPEQVKFRRLLANAAVTVEEMVAHRAMFVAAVATGRHVLAIQDTSEINYQAQSGRKRRLGTVGNGSDIGLFVHPVLAVDATTQECLGLIDAQVWRRTKSKADNYEKWARLPDRRTHLLTRASQDRSLAEGGRLFPTLAGFAEAHRFMLDLPARPGKRSARETCMVLRFGRVRIRRPAACSDPRAPREIELSAIEVRELDP